MQHPAMPRTALASGSIPGWRPCLLAAVALLVLGGCASGPTELPPSEARAQQLAARGDQAGAAAVYERLAATNPPPLGTEFAHAALRAWLAAGRPEEGLRLLAGLPEPATAALQLEQRLLNVQLLLAAGRPADAWTQLGSVPEPKPATAAYLALRQRVALAAGRPADGVRAGVALQQALTSDTERDVARRELLALLREAAARGTRLDPGAQRDAVVKGWLELGQLASAPARSPIAAAREVDRWRSRNANHPAAGIAMAEVMQAARGSPAGSTAPAGTAAAGQPALASVLTPAQSVALLLPLGGRQAAAASLVRDGFKASLDGLPAELRPTLRVYDTTALGASGALAAAQADGVQFIVGPLTRDEAVQAALDTQRRVPVLLLNQLPAGQDAPRGVWQFALSPEDEARQVASQALAQGQRRALLIAPSGDWGNRVAAAFRDSFQAGGGSVLVASTYDTANSDFAGQVSAALRIEDSRARHAKLEKLTNGKLNFEPRRRGDLDLVFAAGQPVALRQIRPMLRFYRAGDLPTYMTSEGFDPDPAANRDIDGVSFPDSPWMLQETGSIAELRAATQSLWAAQGQRASRLFAFGYDAAQLSVALRDVRWPWPLAGATGQLEPDAQGRIRRELDWALVRNGKPQALAPAQAR
jgi:uncharacterized protein